MTSPGRQEARQGGRLVPDRLYMDAPGLTAIDCHAVALLAVRTARSWMPKMTGSGSRSLQPLWGNGYFGIRWEEDYIWFQEIGVQPFTMRRLAGKLIPMWIPDPTGEERRKNPKAKTKRSEDGRIFVLIFRKVGKRGGQAKGSTAHYPGQSGRIGTREAARPHTSMGKVAGAIAAGNVGVWWRHPGLTPRSFLHRGMVLAAVEAGIDPGPVQATSERRR